MSLSKYCPIHGEPLLPTGECPKSGCHYVLKDDNVIDISFKSQGIAKALSNLCNYHFFFDGVDCNSMESFIQSLRTPQIMLQREICSMSGPFSYSIRTMLPDWRETGTVYWKGDPIDRHSIDYYRLIADAYFNLCGQSSIFSYALEQSKGYILRHSIGCDDKSQTLLSPDEYISFLNNLRGK